MNSHHPKNIIERLSQEIQADVTDVSLSQELDNLDGLSALRNEFFIPKNKDIIGVDLSAVDGSEDCVYFNGNSLGLQPKKLQDYYRQELNKWALRGLQGQRTGEFPWEFIDLIVSEKMAPVVGAETSEVMVMNTLTINLHLLLVSFYQPTKQRHKVLIETKAFPSDHYAVESQIRTRGYDPKTSIIYAEPRKGEYLLHLEDILNIIEKEGESIAVILLPGVHYFTGQLLDMKTITRAGHEKGCFVGFDIAHAVGNVPIHLHDWDVDFAAWCNYKYLCAGPGAIGAAFLHSKFDNVDLPALRGWWSHREETRFDMTNEADFTPGIRGHRISNPCVPAILPLLPFFDIYEKTDVYAMRSKSLLLTGYFELLLTKLQEESREKDLLSFHIITPSDPEQRGAQLSVRFQSDRTEAFKECLMRHGVMVDYRNPDVVRMTPSPLYNSFHDVHECYVRFKAALRRFTDDNQEKSF